MAARGPLQGWTAYCGAPFPWTVNGAPWDQSQWRGGPAQESPPSCSRTPALPGPSRLASSARNSARRQWGTTPSRSRTRRPRLSGDTVAEPGWQDTREISARWTASNASTVGQLPPAQHGQVWIPRRERAAQRGPAPRRGEATHRGPSGNQRVTTPILERTSPIGRHLARCKSPAHLFRLERVLPF